MMTQRPKLVLHYSIKIQSHSHTHSWFAKTSSKIKLTTFLTKSLHNVNNPILKVLCKFQVDISINARVTTVQSLENLHTFKLWQPCWWAKECPSTHFTILNQRNSPFSLAYNSVLIGPNSFKFGCIVMVLMMLYAYHQLMNSA